MKVQQVTACTPVIKPLVQKREKEFTYLLKERVCPLVIKLLSPMLPSDLAYAKSNASATGDSAGAIGVASITASEFAINVRLYRIILLLCSKYFSCLYRVPVRNTELIWQRTKNVPNALRFPFSNYIRYPFGVVTPSLDRLIRDGEYPPWRKALAMEVLFKVISQPDLLQRGVPSVLPGVYFLAGYTEGLPAKYDAIAKVGSMLRLRFQP
ncbi:unnamed protein product [Dibothriocephalus latus]|uniref:Uncharacterized protein n=1 Tax=Dibothriocephalus latus TaxID=60516 RepID=A0A3P6U6Z5_DIBLA|nr:unnamed protein product [Dibothriocephalus latus]